MFIPLPLFILFIVFLGTFIFFAARFYRRANYYRKMCTRLEGIEEKTRKERNGDGEG